MDYSGDLASVQRDLARSHDMDRRRSHVLAALAPVPGDRVIEVGCGGGLLLRELGRATAPDGVALGVDISRDQVDAAARTCADVPHVRVEVASATALSADDGSFDASVSTQVLEYVVDVDVAVRELARVTRHGGRLVNVATNWSSLMISGGDARLNDVFVAAWDHHAPHPDLPVALPGLLRDAGFTAIGQTPLPLVNRTFTPTTWAYGIARLMADFGAAHLDLDDDVAARWLAGLADAASRDELFVSAMPMITTATRCASPPPARRPAR
ncbi:MAG: methyltransferase domain-containing protein [Actinomycetota bacterium]